MSLQGLRLIQDNKILYVHERWFNDLKNDIVNDIKTDTRNLTKYHFRLYGGDKINSDKVDWIYTHRAFIVPKNSYIVNLDNELHVVGEDEIINLFSELSTSESVNEQRAMKIAQIKKLKSI